jgi:dTDP-4-amino-4,6-dideoxygalactose transaminase
VAERAAGEIVSLPLFPHITGQQVDHVASRLNDLLEELAGHGG